MRLFIVENIAYNIKESAFLIKPVINNGFSIRNADLSSLNIDMYRGLWRIEESFKVTKSELEARPVYVWTREHIEAHFLACFVSLTIARILENKLNQKYSVGTLLNSLSKAECSLLQQNYYLFDYYDEVLKDIGLIMDIDFGKRIRTLGEIKKILAKTKK